MPQSEKIHARIQSLDEQLAWLRMKRGRLLARAGHAERKRDTRRKSLIGCAVLAAVGHEGVPLSPAGRYNSNMASTTPSVAEAFRMALDLFGTGLDLMRQNLRRSHPEADDEEIERLLREWLLDRPGAEFGDCPGRPVDRLA